MGVQLRYHDPANWPILREALARMGRADLIGNSERHLVPRPQPGEAVRECASGRRSRSAPPAAKTAAKPGPRNAPARNAGTRTAGGKPAGPARSGRK